MRLTCVTIGKSCVRGHKLWHAAYHLTSSVLPELASALHVVASGLETLCTNVM